MFSTYLTAEETQKKDIFEELYNRYKNYVFYVALEYMGSKELAEDAVQETFIKLIKYLYKIEEVDSHKTFSFVGIVTRSVCIDMLRNEKTFRRNTEAYNKTMESRNLTDRELLDRIKALPDIYRDVLLLKYYYGMSNKKISEICSISEVNVRKKN